MNPGFKSGPDADIVSAIKDGTCCAAVSGTWNANSAEDAWGEGYAATKLSFPIWGLGYIGHGQLIKALLVTVVQGLGLYFLGTSGVPALKKFGTLGTVQMEMKFNPLTLKNEVNDYDNSFAILLLSVIAMVVIVSLIAAAMMVVISNFELQQQRAAGKKTKCPKLWRTLFMVTIAVPQFVTLLLVRNLFSDSGIFNTMMANAGVTDFLKVIGLLGKNMDHIPFLTDQHWAKFMIILINIWIGVPYQMLIATGVLMNIPSDMLEASVIDGASPLQSFIYIKLPYLLSVQGPALVTDFVKNVNNFNVIYLLTQDVYITKDQALASSSAKEVDLLVTSFSTDRGINFRRFFPAGYTLDNYINILFHSDSVAQFPRWFMNTFVVACFNCVISTCFVLMVAYALSCCRFKGRKLLQNLSVIVNLFPGVLAMIAVYFVLKYLNLTNSYAGLIMVYAGSSGLGYLICKGFFDTIPVSLREAAKLDGASDARVFFQVVLPMSRPILVYTIISSFMVPWTDFVMAKMILNSGVSADWTVAIGLYNMLQKTLINNYFALFCAGGVLVSIPISILFVIMQKFYVEGITSGADKG